MCILRETSFATATFALSYLTRFLRLMRLAPDIVEAVLDGRQGAEVTLARVMGPFPIQWQAQSGRFA